MPQTSLQIHKIHTTKLSLKIPFFPKREFNIPEQPPVSSIEVLPIFIVSRYEQSNVDLV